jgi:hypothetical protein
VDLTVPQVELRLLRVHEGCGSRAGKGVLRGRRFQVRLVLDAAVGREPSAVRGKDFGIGHQPLIPQPAHGLERRLRVAEAQRVNRARAGDPRNAGGTPLQVVAQMQQIHGNVRSHRHAEYGDCGYQNDHSELALDGKVREPTNQYPSRSPVRFQHL